MSIKIYYDNILSEKVQDEGITASSVDSFSKDAKDIINRIKSKKPGFLDLPENKDLLDDIERYVYERRDTIDNFVVLGIGGSALGNISLHKALNHPFHNLLPREKRGGYPRIFILDNVDPETTESMLDILDPCKTLFNVITKSGSTAETMANFLYFLQKVKEECGDYKDRFVATTTYKKGALWEIAQREGFKTFTIPENVGGRFSVLSAVGLLSARFSGADIRGLIDGAAYANEKILVPDIRKNPSFLLAIVYYLLFTEKKKNMAVLMPYSDRLYEISFWYRQLLAESIGKRFTQDGKEVFVGITPISAKGTTDQHSQVQLYIEGPFDKFITFLKVDHFDKEARLSTPYSDIDALSYFDGHTEEELINYEQLATEYALTKNKRPNLTISLPRVDAFNLGMLYQMFEMQIAILGELFNINAFDQPGVEEGKKATYGLMGRKGYENYREELRKYKKDYVLEI